jgi:glycosyltransferase involved in cell wall biosynthesis
MLSDKKIKLSFIIPVYNAELYLNKCVDSILISNSSDIEIILVDDGSIDKSGQICDEYAEKNKRVRAVHQKNMGVSSARNTGMMEASGDRIFYIDNDDWIDGTKIENLIKILNDTNADIVINRSLIVTEKNDFIKNDFISKEKVNNKSAEEVLNYFRTSKVKIGAPWQYVFKKEIAINNNISFNPNQNGVDDSYFSSALFVNCKSFYLNDDIIYFWRLRLDSQGKTFNKHGYILKMISSIESMNTFMSNVEEEYKIAFLYFNIHKNIFALLGQYYTYSKEDRLYLNKWYYNNRDLIAKSSRYNSIFHRVLSTFLGNFYGTILIYKFATLKGKIFLIFYKTKKPDPIKI